MRTGKLIVLEGTDGSGKSTQFELLLRRFRKEKIKLVTMKFPQYGKKSAGLVEEYLRGAYGKKPESVSPYAASLFYAVDRFDAAQKIKKWLSEGKTVLLDRYVDSNAAHQGGKIHDPKERKKFLQWLYQTEYNLLSIPQPDLVIITHLPWTQALKLIQSRQGRKKTRHDIHDKSTQHLKDTEAAYVWLAKQYPKNHRLIECIKNDTLLPPAEIHEKIWKIITPVLSSRT